MEYISKLLKSYDFFEKMNFAVKSLHAERNFQRVWMVENLDTFEKYKVRTNTEKYPNTVQKESYFIKKFESMPRKDWMPEIIYLSQDQNILVLNYIDGEPLNDLEHKLSDTEKGVIREKLLKVLDEFHSLPISSVIDEKTENWYDYLDHRFAKDLCNAKHSLQDNEKEYIVSILHSYKKYLTNVKPCLLHGDFKLRNIIYNKEKEKIYLIDFESCKIGDAFFDISRISSGENSIFNDKELRENEIYWLYRLDTMLHWLAVAMYKRNEIEPTAHKIMQECLQYFRSK